MTVTGRRLVLVLVLVLGAAACTEERRLQILLGPDESSLSVGFACQDGSGQFVLARDLERRPDGTYAFNVVIDLIEIGSGLPGCRAESLLTAAAERCELVPLERRFCQQVVIAASLFPDFAAIGAEVRQQVRAHPPLTTNAPDVPMLARVTLTSQPCAELEGFGPLDPAAAVGCAYSCPFLPDALDGPIAIGADPMSTSCETNLRRCAAFCEM